VFKVDKTLTVQLPRTAGGLGLTVTVGECRVLRVAHGSAAQKAGVRKFDRVAALNGSKLTGQLGAAVAAEKGEELQLRIERPPKAELSRIGAYEDAKAKAMAKASASGGGAASPLRQMALRLKRIMEAAVLRAHPEWGGSRVGDEVQAFSDFLFYVLDSPTLISELAIAIFDSESGFVEVFSGERYQASEAEPARRANLLTIRYVPGHYQALVGAARPTLEELCTTLDAHGVLYVITDG